MNFPKNIEIILVDNGSTDGTEKLLKNLTFKYDYLRIVKVKKNIGYGHGILSGLKEARGEILGWTHADLQTHPADLLRGLKYFSQDNDTDFVKGLRYGRSSVDIIFTICMSFFETILLRSFLWDINAQPTIFKRKLFNSWENPPHDFSLDLYAYFMAKKLKAKIVRFDTHFGKRIHGISSWNVDFSSKIKFIKRTLEFSFKLKDTLR